VQPASAAVPLALNPALPALQVLMQLSELVVVVQQAPLGPKLESRLPGVLPAL
jgi:hypothetical protein